MFRKKLKKTFFVIALCFVSTSFAAKKTGIGQVASNVMEPVNVLSNFVDAACFVIGGSFLFATIIKYIEHRRSPLMIPISTVVFLFIAGIVLILLPFAYLLK